MLPINFLCAQSNEIVLFGGFGGFNISHFISWGTKYTPVYGMSFSHKFKSNFILHTEVNYTEKGISPFLVQDTDVSGNIIGEKMQYYKFQYISLPLKFAYAYGNKYRGSIKLGIAPSYLVFYSFSETSQDKTITTISHNSSWFRKIDMYGLVEIEGSALFFKKLVVNVSGGFQQGIISIWENNNNNPKSRHFGMYCTTGLGYRF